MTDLEVVGYYKGHLLGFSEDFLKKQLECSMVLLRAEGLEPQINPSWAFGAYLKPYL